MVSKNTQVKARNTKGEEIHLSQSQIDSPILDVNSLERMHQFRPDLVDFVIQQTAAEAEHRRKETSCIHKFTFIERMGGLFVSVLICSFGIWGSIYAFDHGSEKLAMTIATVCIGTLAVAYLRRKP